MYCNYCFLFIFFLLLVVPACATLSLRGKIISISETDHQKGPPVTYKQEQSVIHSQPVLQYKICSYLCCKSFLVMETSLAVDKLQPHLAHHPHKGGQSYSNLTLK